MTLAAGTRLGPYEITTLLGAGGMGEVYEARDTRLNRSVAVKVLPPHVASDPELRERFEREARTIAGLNHPNICVLHDVGRDHGVDFLVMEHLEGETLADRLKKGPVPLDQAVRYGIEIADALDKAHRQGVVHRDLKPANIFLVTRGATLPPGTVAGARVERKRSSPGSYAKLLDFGLAKLRTDPVIPAGLSQAQTGERELTGRGTILGTLQSMAPEQLEGKDADARTDVFAFGTVLYEMVTGRKAFEGKSQVSLMASILEHEPKPISELQPLSPPTLEHLIQGCLAKAPDDRWQSVHDVTKELKWIEAGGSQAGTTAVASSRHGRLGWIAAASMAVVLVLASLTAALYVRRQEDTAQTRFSVTTPELASPPSLSVSPDGRRLAFVARNSSGAFVLFVRSLDSVQAQPLPGTEGASFPFWSPDSRHVGFGAQGKLKRIDVFGGPPQNVCDLSGNFGGGTWNADGVIVFNSFPGPLKRVPASGGESTAVTNLNGTEQGHVYPFFLPDGRHFLFWAVGTDAVDVASLDSKERVHVLKAASNLAYSPSGHLLFHRDGTLMAQPFDAKRLSLNGEPVRVADGVTFYQQFGFADFAVSNSGVLMYRTGEAGAKSRLTWYDRAGKSLGPVGTPGQYRGIALSPDGKRIAVHQHQDPTGGDIWVLEQDRGAFTRFTFNASHNMSPNWSRDGRVIAFASDRDGGIFNIYQKSSSGAGSDDLVLKTPNVKFPEDWAPDGQTMLFADVSTSQVDVSVLPLSGERTPTPFVKTEFQEGVAKFSPDGRWIAYGSNESGRFEVYVQPYPQSTGKWQISTQGGNYARWARSGKELFYLTDEGTLMAVDVHANGPAFSAGTPRALFKTAAMFEDHPAGSLNYPYDVTADGQRFVINERLTPDGQSAPLTVVLNWVAALRK